MAVIGTGGLGERSCTTDRLSTHKTLASCQASWQGAVDCMNRCEDTDAERRATLAIVEADLNCSRAWAAGGVGDQRLAYIPVIEYGDAQVDR